MIYTVIYDKTNGNIVASTTVPDIKENLAVADFEVEDGRTLVSVDVSKEKHVLISKNNAIAEAISAAKAMAKAEEIQNQLLALNEKREAEVEEQRQAMLALTMKLAESNPDLFEDE